MVSTRSFFIAVTVAVTNTLSSLGAEPLAWPQFRGPNGSGVADGQKPPVEVGPDKNVTWKVKVPSGLSSPIVVGDKLVLTAFENEKLYTIAYNRADGSEAWRAEAPYKKLEPFNKVHGSPAASSCATDGERIVSYFGSCGLFCYDLTGQELWKHEMPSAVAFAGFGTGVSPIIADGAVVLLRDVAKDPQIIAFDIETGDVKWDKKRESKSSFGTPTVWKTDEGTYVAAPGYGKLIGYNIKNGDPDWFVEGMPAACCTSPVAADGNLFFAGWSPGGPDDKDFQMPTFDSILKDDTDKDGALSKAEAEKTGFKDLFDNQDGNKDGKISRNEWDAVLNFAANSKSSAFALKPGGKGNVTESGLLWKQTKGLPYVASAILYRGQYIMVKDGGTVTAYDAKRGKPIDQQRLSATGSYYASPVAANGKVYFTSLTDGTITVVEGGAPKLKVVAENPPLEERTAATPAIADDTLYVRTEKYLYAFAEKN
jgi:outer membrane protein assembly factor BamB